MICPYQCGPDSEGMCLECGQPVGASGCDGGSWVHLDMRPDAVVLSSYSYGKLQRQVLRNGVVIQYKNGGIKWPVRNVGEMHT